jgi:predicted nucleic acid-binding protein
VTYFDSRYLAKLYLLEPDSRRVRAHAEAAGNLICSAIGWGEVIATLHRHLRDKLLTREEFQRLSEQVASDVGHGLWKSIPVTHELMEARTRYMMKLPDSVFLRAADALHLTTAAEAGLHEIFSSNRQLCAAAQHFGLTAVTL